jgi:hypothetical protein
MRARRPGGWGQGGGRDVLVVPEQVGGVVAVFDLDQPVPGGPRVGLVDPAQALVARKPTYTPVVPSARSAANRVTQAWCAGVSSGRSSTAQVPTE